MDFTEELNRRVEGPGEPISRDTRVPSPSGASGNGLSARTASDPYTPGWITVKDPDSCSPRRFTISRTAGGRAVRVPAGKRINITLREGSPLAKASWPKSLSSRGPAPLGGPTRQRPRPTDEERSLTPPVHRDRLPEGWVPRRSHNSRRRGIAPGCYSGVASRGVRRSVSSWARTSAAYPIAA